MDHGPRVPQPGATSPNFDKRNPLREVLPRGAIAPFPTTYDPLRGVKKQPEYKTYTGDIAAQAAAAGAQSASWKAEWAQLHGEGGPARVELFSPSKINLFLRVTERRSDGFHDLASLFHAISLGDRLEIMAVDAEEDSLVANTPDVPTDGTNLVIRAFELYREKTGASQHFAANLTKVVPTGAGLGGGSANGATALWAANEICGRLASEQDLLEWSAEIGSDCPFFFSEGAAYVTGRGDLVEDVRPPLNLATPMLLVKPSESCPTPAIFKGLGLEPGEAPPGAEPRELMARLADEGPSDELCINDLEPPALEVVPRIAQIKEDLKAMAEAEGKPYDAVFMSGSGSTVVCMGRDDAPEAFLSDPRNADLFIAPTRLIARKRGVWFAPVDVDRDAREAPPEWSEEAFFRKHEDKDWMWADPEASRIQQYPISDYDTTGRPEPKQQE